MKLIGLIIIGVLFASCTNERQKQESNYLTNEISHLNDRVNFIQSSLLEINELDPPSIRNHILLDKATLFDTLFTKIQQRLINGESINEHLEDIDESIIEICHMMGGSNNDIDDFIQRKFVLHLTELKMLNMTVSNFNNDLELIHSVKRIQEGFLSTFFTLSRTDKYTFEKAEIVPYDRNYSDFKTKRGDSIEVTLFPIAYDSTYLRKIIYWVDDSTKNTSNAIEFNDWGPLTLGGETGEHTVVGKYYLYPNNREDYLDFKFEYTVE
jgi:hypothetical protein